MKKVALSVVTAFVFFVAMAVAQTSTPQSSTQGTESSSPSMQQGTEPSQSTGQMKHEKGMKEHTLRGCVDSDNGTYKLAEKSGKEVTLTGSDIAAHVGHEVKVRGNWENAASSPSSSSSSSSAAGSSSASASGREFNVSSVQMIASSCPNQKGSSSPSSQSQPPQK